MWFDRAILVGIAGPARSGKDTLFYQPIDYLFPLQPQRASP